MKAANLINVANLRINMANLKINVANLKINMAIILMGFIISLACADIIEQNDYIVFTCNNATDGSLLCSTATVDLYDSDGNVAVSGASATNIATGKFKYQVKNSTDRYTIVIDCCSGAIDYAFPVYVTPYTETKAGYLDAPISSRSNLTASDIWNYTLSHNLNSSEILVALYDSIILSGFSASSIIQNPFYYAYHYCDKYAKLMERYGRV